MKNNWVCLAFYCRILGHGFGDGKKLLQYHSVQLGGDWGTIRQAADQGALRHRESLSQHRGVPGGRLGPFLGDPVGPPNSSCPALELLRCFEYDRHQRPLWCPLVRQPARDSLCGQR